MSEDDTQAAGQGATPDPAPPDPDTQTFDPRVFAREFVTACEAHETSHITVSRARLLAVSRELLK